MLLLAVCGVVMAEDNVVYTFAPVKNSSNTDYTQNYDVTINSLLWSVPGNQSDASRVRIGGKSLDSVDRNIYSKVPISDAVTKITLNHNGKSADKLTVNSITLTVASDENFSNVIETISEPPTIAKQTAGSIDFIASSDSWPANSYYKFTINISNPNNANYGFDITSIIFIKNTDGPEDPNVSFEKDNISVEVGRTINNTLTKPSNLPVTYSSSNTNVATVDENGEVTGVSIGTATITASWAALGNLYNQGSKQYTINVINPTTTTYYKVTSNKQICAGNDYILISYRNNTTGKGYYAIGAQGTSSSVSGSTSVRDALILDEDAMKEDMSEAYISSGSNITYITLGGSKDEWTFTGSDNNKLLGWDNTSSSPNRLDNSGKNTTWIITEDFQVKNAFTGEERYIQLNYNNGKSRFACYTNTQTSAYLYVKEGYQEATSEPVDPEVSFDNESITLEVGETAINGISKPNDLTVTYTSDATGVVTVNAEGVLTGISVGTANITATWAAVEGIYNAGSKSYTVNVIEADPNKPGSEANPYTVAQARSAIDSGDGITGVYAKGIVSEIVTAYNSQYGNISYNISDDGTTTAPQLEAYRGKSYNGENFTSADDIQVGDEVVIYGNLTLYQTSTYEFAADNQLVSLERKNKVTATINKTDLTLSDGENSAEITIIPSGISASYTSSDESVATVSETGIVTAVGAGTAIITASWAVQTIEGATYEAGSEEFEVTVNEPIQCVFEEDYYTRFDFTQNGWGLPEGNKNILKGTGTYKNSGKTVALDGSSNGFYYSKDGFLLLGKRNATLTLPAFDFDVAAIEVTGRSGASASVKQNIFVDQTAVSTETTGAEETNIYFIDKEHQAAGTVYTLTISSSHNTQITEIKVYKKDAFVEMSVTDAGYRTYCDSEGLDFSVASDGMTAYIVEGVEAEGSTNLVLKEVTNVPAATGLLIQAEAGSYYVAKSAATAKEEATSESPVITTDDVKDNQLVGVVESTEIEPSIIVLMNGQEGVGFYKTSKTFTVGANTAYLPLSVLETVAPASSEGGVKTFNLFGFEDDTPTVINSIVADELTGKDTVIYNLHGQRVSRMEKGIYIVNGKKVLVK